jgi:hypothetical protein
MADPYRALAERESARADDRATAARAAATSATRATIARVASAAIAAAKAPDPNRALDDLRLEVQGARAADLDRAERQALAALLAALSAGYLYDAAQRATLVASAALAVTVADDPPDAATLAIAGYSAAQLARLLRDQLARTIDRTLTLPMAGALPVEALPGALGQVADQHAARVADAVDEGYHAGAKAAARDLGTAIRAAAEAHAGAPTADVPAPPPSAPPAPEARQAGAGGPGRGGSGGGAGGSVSGSGDAGGIRVTITAPPVPAGERAPAGEVWFQYHTRMDNRVRPSHRALEGTVWRVDDIAAPVPPIDWGCRCFTSFCQPPDLEGGKLPPPEAPPDGTAADKKFGEEPHPVPRAEIYEVWLDQHIDGWRAILAAAKRAKPVDQLLVIVRELRATGRSAADARDVATMILGVLRG